MEKEKKYPRRQTALDAVVLHRLMDGEIHTRQELANRAEVSRRTIQRSIERLGMYFIIHTFRGGVLHGGIYLDNRHLYFGLQHKR